MKTLINFLESAIIAIACGGLLKFLTDDINLACAVAMIITVIHQRFLIIIDRLDKKREQ